MSLWDVFELSDVIDSYQLLVLVGVLALIAFGLITYIILNKGYELGAKRIEYNLMGTVTSIVLFGMALGIFVIAMLLSPGYVTVALPFGENADMGLTLLVIAFITSMISVTFLVYTKRGGF